MMPGSPLVGDTRTVGLTDGTRALYACAGDSGAPVVLVHGGASDHHDWDAALPVLAATHRVFAPCLPGYGGQPRKQGAYVLKDFSDFLLCFMDALGIKRAHLVGHSLGGRVCLEAARLAPERVDRLVLIAPMGFGRLSRRGFVLSTSVWYISKALRRTLPYPALSVELDERRDAQFADVKAPTLVMWGQRDMFFSYAYARRVQAAIPQAQVRLFPRSGHAPHKNEPDAFHEAVVKFLV